MRFMQSEPRPPSNGLFPAVWSDKIGAVTRKFKDSSDLEIGQCPFGCNTGTFSCLLRGQAGEYEIRHRRRVFLSR